MNKDIILIFGKDEKTIMDYIAKQDGSIIDLCRYRAVTKRHEFRGFEDKEVECIHAGSWESQSFNLYLEAVAYYKKVPAPHQYL